MYVSKYVCKYEPLFIIMKLNSFLQVTTLPLCGWRLLTLQSPGKVVYEYIEFVYTLFKLWTIIKGGLSLFCKVQIRCKFFRLKCQGVNVETTYIIKGSA